MTAAFKDDIPAIDLTGREGGLTDDNISTPTKDQPKPPTKDEKTGEGQDTPKDEQTPTEDDNTSKNDAQEPEQPKDVRLNLSGSTIEELFFTPTEEKKKQLLHLDADVYDDLDVWLKIAGKGAKSNLVNVLLRKFFNSTTNRERIDSYKRKKGIKE